MSTLPIVLTMLELKNLHFVKVLIQVSFSQQLVAHGISITDLIIIPIQNVVTLYM